MLLRGCDFSIAMLIVFVVSVTGAGVGFGKTIYVDCDATGAPNGSSWPNAYTDLQDALDDPCLVYGDEIWVAEGVYKPTLTRFLLVDGVEMYGGFAGDETSLEERDYEQNKTYLSGDLGGGNQSSRIVLTNNGVGAATILDGFEITGGYRGIYSYQSEEIISNCVISQNSGDGIYCDGSGPAIDSCIIEDNGQDGINPDQGSSVAITSCIVRNNGADGIYYLNAGSSIVANNWIHHNDGNGIYFAYSGAASVRNNTIVYNSQKGIYRNQGTAPEISNCILWGNVGDDLYLCSATYSCFGGADPCEGNNIATDPNFLYSVSVVYDPNHCDFHLSPVSPCIDMGDPNGDYSGELDIDGEERVIDIADKGDGDIDVDMGADEFSYDLNRNGIIDYRDFAIFTMAWRSDKSSDNWNRQCDFNWNGYVDMGDLAIHTAWWGFGWPYDIVEGDLTGEGIVDYHDFAIFSMAWQSEEDQDSWNPVCDFVVDGLIDIKDLAFFGTRWGFGWP